MTKNEFLATIAATLTALAPEGTASVPASSVYLALGCDMRRYQILADTMAQMKLVKVTASTIALTARGLECARKLA